ncbi:MAG TPA: hypothetical protein PKD99_02260 [Sphingopyxis sp.]|nr:hypothetical protein [Sphingopyxis sp.]HMP43900.1 hypothetical protein [Sphingopyxis sp.]HMQ18067.1 hypothetical protein [Sphingopyxis sp.]
MTEMAETPFAFDGHSYVFLFDWAAMRAYEREMGENLAVLVVEMERYQAAREAGDPDAWRLMPRSTALDALMRAGLSRHHPGLEPGEGARMFHDPGVQAAFGIAFKAATPEADGPGGEGANPAGEPGPAAAKRPRASTGTRSSRAGSRSGKPKSPSGARRPA